MVKSTITGTCHHELNLARVKSLNKNSINRFRPGSLGIEKSKFETLVRQSRKLVRKDLCMFLIFTTFFYVTEFLEVWKFSQNGLKLCNNQSSLKKKLGLDYSTYLSAVAGRAETKALIGGGAYSYIRVLPDEFLLKSTVMTTDFKRNSSGRTRIYEYTPPPPPINALVSALVAATLRFHLYSFQRLSLRYLWSFVKSPYGIKISQERFWEWTVVLAFPTFSYVPEFLEVSKFLQIGL